MDREISYQSNLFHKRLVKKFTVNYMNVTEKFDSFADAHNRRQRLRRMGIKAVMGAVEDHGNKPQEAEEATT